MHNLQERCRELVLSALAPQPLPIHGICKVVKAELGEDYDRNLVVEALAALDAMSEIESDRGPNPYGPTYYFVAKRAPWVKVIPAASAPLPPMQKSTWYSALASEPAPYEALRGPEWLAAVLQAEGAT